jgi:hypothetical protein
MPLFFKRQTNGLARPTVGIWKASAIADTTRGVPHCASASATPATWLTAAPGTKCRSWQDERVDRLPVCAR